MSHSLTIGFALMAFLGLSNPYVASAETLHLQSPSVEPTAFGITEVGDLRVVADIDNDGMDDSWENATGLDAFTDDGDEDMDADGLSNADEFVLGTEPGNEDSDGDGATDGVEVAARSDRNDANSTSTLVSPLVSMTVTPEAVHMVRNTILPSAPSVPLTLTATYTNGSSRDVSDDVLAQFQSFNAGIASISGNDVIGLTAGTATVLVSYRGKSALVSVEVETFDPMPVAAINTPGYAYDVAVQGNIAFVADGNALIVINIGDPSAPAIVGSQSLPGAFDVALLGTRAFVAQGNSGLGIVDISNPASLSLLSQFDTTSTVDGIAIDDGTIYFSENSGGARTRSISTDGVVNTVVGDGIDGVSFPILSGFARSQFGEFILLETPSIGAAPATIWRVVPGVQGREQIAFFSADNTDVDISLDGKIYTTLEAANAVHIIDKDRSRWFGSASTWPWGVSVHGDGRVYVSTTFGRRVDIFRPDGSQESFGVNGPQSTTFDPLNNVYVGSSFYNNASGGIYRYTDATSSIARITGAQGLPGFSEGATLDSVFLQSNRIFFSEYHGGLLIPSGGRLWLAREP